MEEINQQTKEKPKVTKTQKIIIIILVVATIATIVTLCVVNNIEKEITQMEFESLDDWSLTFTLFLGLGREYTGKINVKEKNFDIDTVEMICDNPKIIDVKLGEKGKGCINFSVTTKYNGEAIIYAQTKDGRVRTSNKKIKVWGGADAPLTDEEKSLQSIKNGMNISRQQARAAYGIFKKVGFERIESATYVSEEGNLSYYICTTSDLAIDVYLNSNIVNVVKVVDNDDELILYDLTKGGYIKTISNEECELFKNKQKETATKLIRKQVASIVTLSNFKPSNPDSVGGVDIKLTINNNSDKTIKYVVMSFYAKNAVGDMIYCRIKGDREELVRMTGPIAPGESKSGTCQNYWYNSEVHYYGLLHFSIEYTDGTMIVFSREEMNALEYNYNNGVR